MGVNSTSGWVREDMAWVGVGRRLRTPKSKAQPTIFSVPETCPYHIPFQRCHQVGEIMAMVTFCTGRALLGLCLTS